MERTRERLVVFALLALGLGAPGPVAAGLSAPAFAQVSQREPTEERREARRAGEPGKRGKVVLWWEHLVDSNEKEYDDFSAFLAWKQMHAQVWAGEYTDGFQVGGYLLDKRRSTYGAFYRFRDDFDHVVQFDTEQILKKGFVAAGSLRFLKIIDYDAKALESMTTGGVIGDEYQLQVGAGFDWYWGDYNFLSFRAINDPREGGRWSFITSHRFQRTPDYYIQPGIILRTDNNAGWFLRGKIKMFVWNVGDFDRFDYTDVDRTTYAAGIEIPF